MNEIEFQEILEGETGKQLGVDFGFIMGTMTLYALHRGHMSSGNHQGFEVWKTYGEGQRQITLTPKNHEESLIQILNFLNGI